MQKYPDYYDYHDYRQTVKPLSIAGSQVSSAIVGPKVHSPHLQSPARLPDILPLREPAILLEY